LTNACEANPELWFSEKASDIDLAKEACGFCPDRTVCGELGENEEFGVWGGNSPEDRIRQKRFRVLLMEELANNRIRNMRAEGVSISGIARELGIPRKTLADRLRRLTMAA
jgi:transcriptional regulator of acetoin/glycerol metabolism